MKTFVEDSIDSVWSNMSSYHHHHVFYNFTGSFNICIPIQRVYNEYVDLSWVQVIIGTLYCIVLLFGFVANLLTLICLLSKSCQLGLNVNFLISLSASDLFISLTSLPITAIQTFTRKWLWGLSLCRYVPLFQGASFFINSFTLVAIAVERYLIIARDTNKSKSRKNIIILTLIWVFGVVAAVPYALYMELKKVCAENHTVCLCGEFCEENWPSDYVKFSYGGSAFFIQFGLPFCVLAFCYWRVGRTVAVGVKHRLNRENLSVASRQRLIRRKKRTANITILLIVCFVAPWLPVNVLNVLRDHKFLPEEQISIIFAVGHLVAMTSILWNPVIYCWHNKQFLDAFRSFLMCNKVPWLTTFSSNDETYKAIERGTVTSFRCKTPSTHLSRIASQQRKRSVLSLMSRRSRLSTVSVYININKATDDDTSRVYFEHTPLKKAASAEPATRHRTYTEPARYNTYVETYQLKHQSSNLLVVR